MVGNARLLLLLPWETMKVAPDNTVVLTLKPGNQTSPWLTQLIIVVKMLLKFRGKRKALTVEQQIFKLPDKNFNIMANCAGHPVDFNKAWYWFDLKIAWYQMLTASGTWMAIMKEITMLRYPRCTCSLKVLFRFIMMLKFSTNRHNRLTGHMVRIGCLHHKVSENGVATLLLL